MRDNGRAIELSVVVGLISGRVEDLERCLRALAEQRDPPAMEVVVPYDPPCAAVTGLADRYPEVRFLEVPDLDTAAARRGASREHHDTLRTVGLRNAAGRYVALTEDHAVAAPDWAATLVRLLEETPTAAAVGGAMACGSERLLNRAVYLCDFGRYQNPLPEGPSPYVSDSNIVYRRADLEAVRETWQERYHETLVHRALAERGREIWLTPRTEVAQLREGLGWRHALKERYVWGRSFAAARVRGQPPRRRLVFAVASLALPALLTLRIARGVVARRAGVGRMVAALPALLLLTTFWASGELVGYLSGRASGD